MSDILPPAIPTNALERLARMETLTAILSDDVKEIRLDQKLLASEMQDTRSTLQQLASAGNVQATALKDITSAIDRINAKLDDGTTSRSALNTKVDMMLARGQGGWWVLGKVCIGIGAILTFLGAMATLGIWVTNHLVFKG